MKGPKSTLMGWLEGLRFPVLLVITVVLLVVAFQDLLAGAFDPSSASLALLLIMIALVPVSALDRLLESLMAVSANALAIFLRRYVMAPAM